MKKITYFLASSAAALLLVAAPTLASAHNDSDKDSSFKSDSRVKTELSWKNSINFLLHGGTAPQPPQQQNGEIRTTATITAINGSVLTVKAKNDTVYTVNTSGAEIKDSGDVNATVAQMKVGDTVTIKGNLNGSTITAEKVSDSALRLRTVLAANGAAGAGVVTSVNGSTFTYTPYGTKATTTVSTASTTIYRVNGEATTSAALAVGSNVVLAGTTNSDTSIAASIVGIFTRGFGFFKHVLFH